MWAHVFILNIDQWEALDIEIQYGLNLPKYAVTAGRLKKTENCQFYTANPEFGFSIAAGRDRIVIDWDHIPYLE